MKVLASSENSSIGTLLNCDGTGDSLRSVTGVGACAADCCADAKATIRSKLAATESFMLHPTAALVRYRRAPPWLRESRSVHTIPACRAPGRPGRSEERRVGKECR